MHQHPAIQGCRYIRQTVDIIEKGEQEDWASSPPFVNKRMVLEWMDTDLWLFCPFGNPFSNPYLPAIVTKSILEALVVFQQTGGVHTGKLISTPCASKLRLILLKTDVNRNDIFLANLEAPVPTVKLGDLGNGMFLQRNVRLVLLLTI